jgi:hypothetical protein
MPDDLPLSARVSSVMEPERSGLEKEEEEEVEEPQERGFDDYTLASPWERYAFPLIYPCVCAGVWVGGCEVLAHPVAGSEVVGLSKIKYLMLPCTLVPEVVRISKATHSLPRKARLLLLCASFSSAT